MITDYTYGDIAAQAKDDGGRSAVKPPLCSKCHRHPPLKGLTYCRECLGEMLGGHGEDKL